MSADNGIIIRRRNGRYLVSEYNASTGSEVLLAERANLEEAIGEGQSVYTEYGISFDLEDA